MFECKQDLEVQHFLNNKAIDSEERDISRTHLLFDEDRFSNGDYFVEGYFTLTIKNLEFVAEISNSTIKKLCGGYKKSDKSFVLVAQLGKYKGDTYISDLHLPDIFKYIMKHIRIMDRSIPVKFLLIECKKPMLDTNLYQKLGFKEIQHVTRVGTSGEAEELYQLVYELQ